MRSDGHVLNDKINNNTDSSYRLLGLLIFLTAVTSRTREVSGGDNPNDLPFVSKVKTASGMFVTEMTCQHHSGAPLITRDKPHLQNCYHVVQSITSTVGRPVAACRAHGYPACEAHTLTHTHVCKVALATTSHTARSPPQYQSLVCLSRHAADR